MSSSVVVSDPEQDKYLEDATESVKKQSFFMKRALDTGVLRDGLKMASLMIGELRTSRLTPKNYYELFMNITDQLRELELFIEEEDQKAESQAGQTLPPNQVPARRVEELYELVQHCGHILPRLYLLITVASVYAKSKKAPSKDILFDLVELCRGVQHPMRGLFLRHYLSQISKDKLPDTGSEYENQSGSSVKDAIEFILLNFAEMNKLWVRLQHQGAQKDKSKREKERRNLRQLVGTNLVRLSEMTGVDLLTYCTLVLPRVLEQVINCKDVMAQEYLMDCLLQVFPIDYHLATLQIYLASSVQLQDAVNIKEIIITFMGKLATYAATNPSGSTLSANNLSSADAMPVETQTSDLLAQMFALFHAYIVKIIATNTKLTLVDILQLFVALLNFTNKVYPDRVDYVDQVLALTVEMLSKASDNDKREPKAIKLVTELLSQPLEVLVLRILELTHFSPLLAFLELSSRKDVAMNIMQAMVKHKASLDSVDKVEAVMRFIAPAIKDEVGAGERTLAPEERFEFEQEQHLVSRLFHLIHAEDTDVHFSLLATARKAFGQGGTHRIEYTLPPLVFGSLQLALRIHLRELVLASAVAKHAAAKSAAAEEDAPVPEAELPPAPAIKSKKLFGFVHETISVLTPHYPELALRLFVHAASISDRCAFDAISYEFLVQAFLAYEDEIADSKQQYAAILLLVSSLQTFVSLSQENWDTLVTKATQHCAKLLKKADQCRAVYQCAHVFWAPDERTPSFRDERRVLACLQRSLKIANGCIGQQLHLFVEILNQYVYFYDRQCPSITQSYLKGLISLIEEHAKTVDDNEVSQQAKVQYENTLKHLKIKAMSEQSERYLDLLNRDTHVVAPIAAPAPTPFE